MKKLFEASDGQEFESEKEAKLHEEIVLAKKEFDKARGKLGKLLAGLVKTADGFPFDPTKADYWWIARSGRLPILEKLYLHPVDFELARVGARLSVRVWVHEDGGNRKWLDISDLYAEMENARRDQVAIMKEVVADLQMDIEKLESEI